MKFFWMVFLCFALIAGFVVVFEHGTHWFGPYGEYIWLVLLLACPLLHVLMHRGHSHRNAGDKTDAGDRNGGHRHG